MHAGLPKTLASSGYKSQKKNRTQRTGKKKEKGRRVYIEEKARGKHSRRT